MNHYDYERTCKHGDPGGCSECSAFCSHNPSSCCMECCPAQPYSSGLGQGCAGCRLNKVLNAAERRSIVAGFKAAKAGRKPGSGIVEMWCWHIGYEFGMGALNRLYDVRAEVRRRGYFWSEKSKKFESQQWPRIIAQESGKANPG